VGSWEYLLDSAVYIAPAFHDYGGAPEDLRNTPILKNCDAFDLSIERIRYLNLRSFHAANHTALPVDVNLDR
jgi:hypothetical protein